MLAMSWRDTQTIRRLIRQTKTLTSRPFGINLVLEWPQSERLAACLEEGVRIVSFSWGDPARYMAMAGDAGAITMSTVGSASAGRAAIEMGIDVIVAQGWESGGHVLGEVATMALVPSVVDAAGPAAVVAAGGIADGRGIAAALALGAQGVWIGTRFLASEEAAAHISYKQRLLHASEGDTIHTELFDVGWPNAPHRVLRNRTYEDWASGGRAAPGERAGEGEAVGRYEDGEPILRYSDSMPRPDVSGDVEAMAMYAGQSVGLVRDIKPARQIVEDLVAETTAAIRRISA
jgi:nitronate monooxygenase